MYNNYKTQNLQKKTQKEDFFGNKTMTLLMLSGMLSVMLVILNLFLV